MQFSIKKYENKLGKMKKKKVWKIPPCASRRSYSIKYQSSWLRLPWLLQSQITMVPSVTNKCKCWDVLLYRPWQLCFFLICLQNPGILHLWPVPYNWIQLKSMIAVITMITQLDDIFHPHGTAGCNFTGLTCLFLWIVMGEPRLSLL